MKKNNKGFMLVEVIVTSTVVLTAMVALYVSFNKLYNRYKTKTSYYNLDSIYATKEMINSMFKNDTPNINNFIETKLYDNNHSFIIEDSSCSGHSTPKSCNTLKDLYKIKNMIFVEYDLSALQILAHGKKDASGILIENPIIKNETFRDYVDYLITYYDIKNTTDEASYIILTEIEDGDNYYYANLRMR